MNTLIVFNHPYDQSFCTAILQSVAKGIQTAGQHVDIIHLNQDNFNPRMTAEDLKGFVEYQSIDPQVLNYQKRIEQAQHLVFIFPIWWDIMPAATKGFIDRVLSPGFAYDHHPRGFGLVPLLDNLKSITVITTMNKPKWMYSLILGNLIRKVMIRSVFKSMGYKNIHWISFNSVKRVSHETRVRWLQRLENHFGRFHIQ